VRFVPPTPLLKTYPDARRGHVALIEPALLGYSALILGPAASGGLAIWNALSLGRMGLAFLSLLAGVVGWGVCGLIPILLAGHLHNLGLVLLVARVWNVGIGTLLAWSQWRAAAGHHFLSGKMVPLLPGILLAVALSLTLPRRIALIVEGFWPVLFGG